MSNEYKDWLADEAQDLHTCLKIAVDALKECVEALNKIKEYYDEGSL